MAHWVMKKLCYNYEEIRSRLLYGKVCYIQTMAIWVFTLCRLVSLFRRFGELPPYSDRLNLVEVDDKVPGRREFGLNMKAAKTVANQGRQCNRETPSSQLLQHPPAKNSLTLRT